MTLGVVLIIAIIILTFVIVRFFEHYRSTLKQVDFTVRVAEASIQEVDELVSLFTTKINDAEQFFFELGKTGQHLELFNNKFTELVAVAKKYPKGLMTTLLMLNRLDAAKGLPKLFNILHFDEELNSMLKDFLKGAVIGGLAVALLTPKTGEEMREVASDKLDELKEKAKNINIDDVRNGIFDKIDELKQFIKTSSKEDIVNKIFEEIKNLYDKIIEYLPHKNETTTEIIEKQ
jgi:gas vesicle protein